MDKNLKAILEFCNSHFEKLIYKYLENFNT